MVDRLERLTDLVLVLLRDARPKSLREIGEEVPGYPPEGEARRQAFERDKRTLREGGIAITTAPIDGPEQVGYFISEADFYLPDLELDADEQAALNLAVAGVHLGDPSGRDALWRLGLPAPTGTQPVADVPALPALPVLWDALRAHRAVRFQYRGEPRQVAPAVLHFRAGWWYLVGLDLDKDSSRTFRVDRMEDLPTADEPGTGVLPDGFSVGEAVPDEPWRIGDGAPVTVEVLAGREVAGTMSGQLHASPVGPPRADGSVVVRFEVVNTAALRSWLLEWGERVVVLGPAEVRAEMLDWLERTAS